MDKADILNFMFWSNTTVFISIHFCNDNGLLQFSKNGSSFVQLQGTSVRVLRDVTFKIPIIHKDKNRKYCSHVYTCIVKKTKSLSLWRQKNTNIEHRVWSLVNSSKELDNTFFYWRIYRYHQSLERNNSTSSLKQFQWPPATHLTQCRSTHKGRNFLLEDREQLIK